MRRTRIERAAKYDTHLGLFGGLIGGNVGHIVRVSTEQTEAEIGVLQTEFGLEIRLNRRNEPDGTNTRRNAFKTTHAERPAIFLTNSMPLACS